MPQFWRAGFASSTRRAMIKVSVIVPTFNRLDRLKQVLSGFERQTEPLDTFEVIVVSDGATDGTNEFLQALQSPLRLKPVIKDNGGVASARNTGLQYAQGPLVLFVDDDVVPAPELLTQHLRCHETSEHELVVLGPMLNPDDFAMSSWVRWEQAKLLEQYGAMARGDWTPTARQFYTGNSSLALAHVVAAGGFDERFKRAEDVELGYRLMDRGLRFKFNPEAIGHHYAQRSFQSWMTTPYVYGRNDVIFSRDKGQKWLLETVQREYRERHILVRTLVRLCLSRRLPSTLAMSVLRLIAAAGDLVGIERISFNAYSGIFNLCLYQGIADELGGRDRFLSLTSS